MQRVGRNFRSSWTWQICFEDDPVNHKDRYQLRHYEYGLISAAFSGWTLRDITGFTIRERRYWSAVAMRRLGIDAP